MAQRYEIRNSTAEFLIFQIENREQGIEVMYADETTWCIQKAIASLFDCDRNVITKRLSNIFVSGELKEDAVCAKFAHTASERGYVLDKKRIVTAVLEFAESRAKRHIPMTMEDWAKRIDAYLTSDERPLFDNAGNVTHEEAVLHAETEFGRYRIVQDRLFQSGFDRYLGALPF